MKLHEKINHILLGTLWCIAILLVLDFCLNTVYNFNIFSNAHWQYVAAAQASNQPIDTGFYIIITLAITTCILGLYMILRPKFRKIPMPKTKNEQNIHQSKPEIIVQKTEQKQDNAQKPNNQIFMQRPPHLHIQIPTNTIKQPTNQPIKTQKKEQKNNTINTRYTHEIREIFENNNYKVLSPKTISGTPLSLIALGTNEIIWMGGCNISHEQMADVILAFKSVFQETLEDIEIDINAFIINPSDQDSVDAILDLNNLEELKDIIDKNPNEPESDADKESGNMDAFTGYIETVLTYLGNK